MSVLLSSILFFLLLIFFVSATDLCINNIFYMPRPPIIKAASNKKLMTPRSSLLFFFAKFKSRLNISSFINTVFISLVIYGFAILIYGLLIGTNLAYFLAWANDAFDLLTLFVQYLYDTGNVFLLSACLTVLFCNTIVLSSARMYSFKYFSLVLLCVLVLNIGLMGLAITLSLKDIVIILVQCLFARLHEETINFSLLEMLQFFNLIALNESQRFVPTQLL